jgi:uncharacterized protein UPF0158
VNVDWDGLVVAFESRSQLITHFFDRETGDVVQCVKDREPQRHEELTSSKRYLALPKDKGERGMGEIELFLAEVEDERLARKLKESLSAPDPVLSFREALQASPREESGYFQFKHRRAVSRAEAWLDSMGIKFDKKPEPEKAPREFPEGAPGGPRPR